MCIEESVNKVQGDGISGGGPLCQIGKAGAQPRVDLSDTEGTCEPQRVHRSVGGKERREYEVVGMIRCNKVNSVYMARLKSESGFNNRLSIPKDRRLCFALGGKAA